MPATKAFLSRPEQDDLIAWMVGHQGNYERYTQWCDKNGIPLENRYTLDYLRRWTQKRRARFQDRARKVEEDLRKASTMDRAARLGKLEAIVAQLEDMMVGEQRPDILVKLAEQLEKTLDRIARERGEYGKAPEDGPDEATRINTTLRNAFASAFVEQKRVTEARTVN